MRNNNRTDFPKEAYKSLQAHMTRATTYAIPLKLIKAVANEMASQDESFKRDMLEGYVEDSYPRDGFTDFFSTKVFGFVWPTYGSSEAYKSACVARLIEVAKKEGWQPV